MEIRSPPSSMVLPGHLSAGFLLTEGILKLSGASTYLTPHQTIALTVIGTLAGDAPDIDLFWFGLAYRMGWKDKPEQHREYITHKPIFWLFLCAAIVFLGIAMSGQTEAFIILFGFVLFAGSWSHLALDSIEYGVTWLWPFSKKRYALSKNSPEEPAAVREHPARPGSLKAHWQFVRYTYLRTWTFWAELVLTGTALYTVSKLYM